MVSVFLKYSHLEVQILQTKSKFHLSYFEFLHFSKPIPHNPLNFTPLSNNHMRFEIRASVENQRTVTNRKQKQHARTAHQSGETSLSTVAKGMVKHRAGNMRNVTRLLTADRSDGWGQKNARNRQWRENHGVLFSLIPIACRFRGTYS